MRDLAKRLDVATMQLYRLVGSLDELIDIVVAEILNEYFDKHPIVRGASWQETLRSSARLVLGVWRTHPAVLHAIQRRPMIGARSMADSELILSVLIDAGFTAEQAVTVHGSVMAAAVGFAGIQVGREAVRVASGLTPEQERAAVQARIENVDGSQLPHLVAALPYVHEQFSDAAYDRLIDLLIAGLEATLPARP